MPAWMKPIPEQADDSFLACPLPFVSQGRLNRAHDSICNAYVVALRAYMHPRSQAPLVAACKAAEDALARRPGKPKGLTALEVVCWYALLREKVPTVEEAEQNREAGARLAVWQAVVG